MESVSLEKQSVNALTCLAASSRSKPDIGYSRTPTAFSTLRSMFPGLLEGLTWVNHLDGMCRSALPLTRLCEKNVAGKNCYYTSRILPLLVPLTGTRESVCWLLHSRNLNAG